MVSPGQFTKHAAVQLIVALVGASLAMLAIPSVGAAAEGRDGPTVTVDGRALDGIITSPLTLTPAFAPLITDYVLRCQPGPNVVSLTLAAVFGGTIKVGRNRGSSVTITESLVENQALIITANRYERVTRDDMGDEDGSDGHRIQYWIRCLPHDFPQLGVKKPGSSPPGWYLTGNINSVAGSGTYAMVLDENGTPVWYRKAAGTGVFNVTLLPDGSIAWGLGGFSEGQTVAFEVYSLKTRTTRWLSASVAPTDFHEFLPMANGDRMMLSDPLKSNVDMTAVGGDANAYIVDCVVQEVSPSGQLVWQWRASDHISIAESSHPIPVHVGPQAAYDPFHCNSIDVDPKSGNLLVSARHTDAVYLIDRKSGMIIWRMGGGSAPSHDHAQVLVPTDDPEGAFHAQHDARFRPNDDVSLYDNQSWDATLAARGVEYKIDRVAGTATVVWSYASSDGQHANATGTFRRLAGGSDNVIGWGIKTNMLFTEVDADGRIMLDVTFPNGEFAYRVQKVSPMLLNRGLLRSTAGLPPADITLAP